VVVLLAGGLVVETAFPRLVDPHYRHVNRAALGLLFWVAVLFLLAVVQAMRPWPIRLSAIAVATVGIGLALRKRNGLGPVQLSFQSWWARAVPLAAIAYVVASLFMMGMRPGAAWDAGTYHLTVPRLYLEHGGFRPIQFNVYSNWPLNQELLFGLGLALHDYFLATLVQWIFAALIVWALLKACTLHGHPAAGPIAACLFLANEVVLYEAGVAYVDLGLAFFFVMALLNALQAQRSREDRVPALLRAGICCGLMAGVKLIGIFGLVSVGAILLWDEIRARGWVRGTKDVATYLVLPCLLLALPWYAKAAWYTGNPVYPFLYDIFRGTEWSRSLGDQFQSWQSSLGMGRSITDYLLLPVRIALQGAEGYQRFDGRISPAWLVCIPLVAAGCWRNIVVRRSATTVLVYFICWAASSQQARFLIPALAVLAFATALSIASLIELLRGAGLRAAAQATAGVIASLLLLYTARETTDEAGRWWYRYKLRDLKVVLDAGVPPIFQYVNATLPEDAKLLFLDTNQGFFCEREYVADSFFEASQVNTFLLRNRRTDQIQRTLLDAGFTHLMIGHDRWGIPYPPTLDEFLQERARLIHTSPQGDRLYEIVRL
jgi:hypothetical protein